MKKLTYEMIFDKTLNFAMYNNDVALIKSLKLYNHQEEPLEHVTVILSFWPDFAASFTKCIEIIPGNSAVDIGVLDLKLDPEYLYSLTERIKGKIRITLEMGGEVLEEDEQELQILAFDEWNGGLSIPEIIAAFVIPNSPIISGLLKVAAGYMEKWTKSSAMDGYQHQDPNRVLQIMAAIYQAICNLNIDYVTVPPSFEERGQRIRLPEDIGVHKIGNCLDLTLLYVSALEAAGLHPLVVFIEGHAFAGCWLIEESFPEGAFADYSLLSKRMADGINEIAIVECTAVTGSAPVDFDSAVRLAGGHFQDVSKFHYFVDIRRARISQIRPLPLRHRHTSYEEFLKSRQAEQEEQKQSNANAPEKLNKINFIESEAVTVRTRLDNWQRQLLDLSLRNSLINFRNTRNTITILCSDLYTLEDSLSDGNEFQLFPIPQELEGSLRDLDVYKKRTGNAFLSELMRSEFSQRRLRTLLTPSELNRTVVNIYRKSRLVMEESGANALYLGIGILKWYENAAAKTARSAPLLLVPMEILKKSSSFGYVLRKKDEEAIFNITLIQYIKSVFGRDLSGLEEMPQDENGVDVRTLFALVRKMIMDLPRWEIEETAVLGVFSFNKFVMWNDIKNRSEQLMENPMVRGLVNGTMEDSNHEIFEESDLDAEVNPAELLVPSSADSSQLAAIYAAAKGGSFVLHGPPGTGKSQTITNMIANLLGNRKTVLFVSEKMAALSVVQRRLEQIGLGAFCMELHSNKTSKKEILKKLEDTLNLGYYKNEGDWEQVTADVRQVRQELNQYMEAMHARQTIGFSLYDAFNELCKLEQFNAPELFTPQEAYSFTQEQFQQAEDFIRRLNIAGQGCGYPSENPWINIGLDTYSSTVREQIRKSAKELLGQLALLPKDLSYGDFKTIQKIYEHAESAPVLEKELYFAAPFEQQKDKLLSFVDVYETYYTRQQEIYSKYNDNIDMLPIDELISAYNIANQKFFLFRITGHNAVYKKLVPYLQLGSKINKKELMEELKAIKDYQTARKNYEVSGTEAALYFGSIWTSAGNQQNMSGQIRFMDELYGLLGQLTDKNLYKELKEQLYQLLYTPELTALSKQYAEGVITSEDLFQLTEASMDEKSIGRLETIIQVWYENLEKLQDYCFYNRVKNESDVLHLNKVVSVYESGEIVNQDVVSAFRKSFYQSWAEYVIGDNKVLAGFSKEMEESKIEKFTELDQKYQMLVKQEIFQNLIAGIPRQSGNTAAGAAGSNPNSEVGMLIRAIHSGGRGTPLRKLFDKIPNLLSRLSPCMLMSPISVAQYLDPNFPPFDVVIFDEASQMPTYEAVGAIARGKSLIVVGDPKQLPPTSFFSNKPVEQDEDIVLQDLESVLDDCLAINMPQKHLSWHYRSRHESLIAFCNYNFYEGKLLTFPSCDDLQCKTSLVKVDGYYDRGKTRQNEIEAKAVVDEILKQLSENPGKSIGVVTFNQAQQILIEDLLDEQLGKNQELEVLVNSMQEEPVFIKNLENVQGDERDIIIFSIGYARDKNGYMSMNFGPINQDGGWRRLNVAISRARDQLIVYSSILGDDISLAKTNSMGVMYLKNFLDYARLGVSALTVSPGAELAETQQMSMIETEVYQRLMNAGYHVKRNVGTSQYKLPLAVLSKKTGRYILGIEFDGKMMRRIKAARDREILMRGVMTGMNWNLYRIWSQKWFRSPDEEFAALTKRIESLEAKSDIDKLDTAVAKKVYEADFSTIRQEEMPEEKTADTYQAADIKNAGMSSEEFYENRNSKIIRDQITAVIKSEAPISFTNICRRIMAAWGIKRAGTRVEAQIRSLCQMLELPETNYQGMVYYWEKGMEIETYSDFRVTTDASERRNIEDIAPEEILAAAHHILEGQISLAEADLAKEVAKIFGYVRLAESTANKICGVLQFGVEKNNLCRLENGRYINCIAPSNSIT